MALTLWHPPIFEVAPAPPPNRSLLAARRRLSRLRPQPALHLAELSSQLERFSFFVLDDFAGRDQAELVSSEVGARALCRVPSGERRGRVHAGQHVSSLRSDVSTWVPVDRAGSTSSSSPALDRLVNRTDALVAELGAHHGAHERLCSMMRWTDALPEVKLRYDDEATSSSTFADFFADATPGSTPLRATILYPAPFAALRERFCEGGDAAFIQSLRQASTWNSGRGGVSGSTFLKTVDDRYLLKAVPKSEFWAFHERAPTYFQFVSNTPTRIPSVLVKILAAVMVEYKTAEGTRATQYLLVQENLFYGKSVSRMCDLKGARRNRGAGADGEGEDGTVLDENLFRFNNGYPLLLSEAAKQRLTRALWNDTLFLASINVMDYSLLVGMVQTSATADGADGAAEAGGGSTSAGGGSSITVEHCGESWTLMVGVIDYCRQYTWREEAEWRIKNATVTKPQHYKRRFREALHRYFMPSIEKYAEEVGVLRGPH